MTTDTSAISGTEAKRAARNASALAAASIVSKAALFGWQIVLAPWLGVFEYGIYGTVSALFAIATAIPNFGMGPVVIRDVSREPDKAGKYLTATLFMQTILALLAYVGVNAAAALLESSETIQAFTAIAGLSLIIDIMGNMCYDILLAQERMVSASIIEVGHIVIRIAVSLIALAAGWGLLGVYGAMLLTGIGRTVILWILLLRNGTRPEWPLDKTIAWPLLINGTPLALAAFMTLAYQQIDKIMTTQFIGETGTGYLTAATVIIFGVINVLNTTVLTATFPLMSRAYGDGDGESFGFMVEKLTLFTLILNVPIVLVLSLFSVEITVPIFGVDFAPTAGVLAILIWYALVTMVAAVLARGMLIQNRQRVVVMIRAVGLIINIGLNAALLPVLNVKGAAVATLVSEALVTIAIALVFRATGLHWLSLLMRTVRLVLVSVITVGVMIALGNVHVVLGIVAGMLIYTVGVLFSGVLARDDWDLLYRMVSVLPGGTFILRYWKRDVSLRW